MKDIDELLLDGEQVVWRSNPEDRLTRKSSKSESRRQHFLWMIFYGLVVAGFLYAGHVLEWNGFLASMFGIFSAISFLIFIAVIASFVQSGRDPDQDVDKIYVLTDQRLLLVSQASADQISIFPEAILRIEIQYFKGGMQIYIQTGYEADQFLSLFDLADAEVLKKHLLELRANRSGRAQ